MARIGGRWCYCPATRDWLNVTPAQRAGVLAPTSSDCACCQQSFLPGSWLTSGLFAGLLSERQSGAGFASHVGRPDRKTPMMSSALNNVVETRRGTYLQLWHAKIFCQKCQRSGISRKPWLYGDARLEQQEAIDPWQVDWSTITASNLPSASSRLQAHGTRWGAINSICEFRGHLFA